MDHKESSWTFFSNHGHVYFLLAANEEITVRDISRQVGITERAVLTLIRDLEQAGYILKKKVGRSNRYTAIANKTLRHPLERNVFLSDLYHLIEDASNE